MSGKAARRAARGSAQAPPRVRSKEAREAEAGNRWRALIWVAPVVVVAVVALYLVAGRGGSDGEAGGSGDYPYAVGEPGPGDVALPLTLPSTAGGEFDLAAYRGKEQVLLYFHEGLTCQPCWDQIKVIEQNVEQLHELGIGPIVSVTTDPIDLIEQKVQDEGITMPVLADIGAQYSTAWTTNRYQMQNMGERNGHSFILVGRDGKILWRADYGGAPKYTMFLPVGVLLRDLKQAIAQSG